MRFKEVLNTFADFFEREKILYALIGGLAIQAWGRDSRTTNDVDVATDGTQRHKIVQFAESCGFETIHESPSYSNHILGGDRIDFMYLYGTTATSVLTTAPPRLIFPDVEMPVARPEHLAAMKAMSMKDSPRRVLIDAADVGFLLGVEGVDRDAIRDFFARHGLLELFDGIEKHSR